MAQEPAIPVQQTIKSTYRTISKLNGDDLPKLKRVNRPELSNRVSLYNTFTKGVLNHTLNVWFKQHSNVMENLRKEQVHVYKSMCRMQRLKRRVQKDEHERRRQEIRRLFQRQRKRHLMRKVVEKFRENVIRKRQERLQDAKISQGGEEDAISTENLAMFAGKFRRISAPNVSTTTQKELEGVLVLEKDSTESKECDTTLPSLAESSHLDDDVKSQINIAVTSKQELENPSSVSSTSSCLEGQAAKKSNRSSASRMNRVQRRKDTLHSIPEIAVVNGENECQRSCDKKQIKTPRKDLLKSRSTQSLPSDLSRYTQTDDVTNRRGSLPSKYKQAKCVSVQSKLRKNRNPKQQAKSDSREHQSSPTVNQDFHKPTYNYNDIDVTVDRISTSNQISHSEDKLHFQNTENEAIKSVARANISPEIDLQQKDSYYTSQHHKRNLNEENQFTHKSFYSSTPGDGNCHEGQEHVTSQSAHSISMHHPLSDQYDVRDDCLEEDPDARHAVSPTSHSSLTQPQSDNASPTSKGRKTSLAQQIRFQKASQAKMRTNLLDSEPVTRYTRLGHNGHVTPMYGLPKRSEFKPPTRKLQHEHEKMLREEHDVELQCQVKINHFFKDLFETKDTQVKPKPVKTEDESPKKPAFTLAGVLSQLYSGKNSSTIDKNSFEWLKKCQYLRVYNPADRKQREKSHDPKMSSWDEAEKRLKSGFLALINNNN